MSSLYALYPPKVVVCCLSRSNTLGRCAESSVTDFHSHGRQSKAKNAGIAGFMSNFFNATMATVAKKIVTELSKQLTGVKVFVTVPLLNFTDAYRFYS